MSSSPRLLLLMVVAAIAAASNERAPAEFRVKFTTTVISESEPRGSFVVEVKRALSPNGANRFYQLVKNKFYNQCGFFRVVKGFVVQFGLAAEPYNNDPWKNKIKDDPRSSEISNTRGTLSFATSGPNTRTTQLFVNLADNSFLDTMGFTPIGRITKGMDVVDRISDVYKERPMQGEITAKGNVYLKELFPKLDYVVSARIMDDAN